MKKIDGITAGAIAFAAFSVWYVLKGKGASAGTGNAGADQVYSMLTNQRRDVGNSIGANLNYLGGGQGLLPPAVQTQGGSYGFQAPVTGFWAT